MNTDDNCFHEFAGAEETTEVPTDAYERSISQFIEEVSVASRKGWETFDPCGEDLNLKKAR